MHWGNQNSGEGVNNWWNHRRFSIIGGACPGCPLKSTPMLKLLTHSQLITLSPFTVANFSPSSKLALSGHPPVSVFLDPRSLLISHSPTEPYPPLHHVFGMTYHFNYALFSSLHHQWKSPNIIFLRLLYLSHLGCLLKMKVCSIQEFIP